MSLLSDFGVEPPTLEEQTRLQEMAGSELQNNIRMLRDIRKHEPQKTPCETFYRFKKELPLSTFLQVYTFDELVDCKFDLPELRELIRLYSTLSPSDKTLYTDSIRRLRQIMESLADADQEVGTIVQRPEPSNYEIEQIRSRQYLAENPPQPQQPPPQQPPPQQPEKSSFFDFFKGGKSRKMSKKRYKKSRSTKSRKSNSRKSRSKRSRSRSKSQTK